MSLLQILVNDTPRICSTNTGRDLCFYVLCVNVVSEVADVRFMMRCNEFSWFPFLPFVFRPSLCISVFHGLGEQHVTYMNW